MSYTPRYPIVLYWSEPDLAFVVEVPDLPGCMADGATEAEALANMHVIIEEWLQTARELNRPIPAPSERLRLAA